MNPIKSVLQAQAKMYDFENNPMLGKAAIDDPDEAHDMMMDTAAEKITQYEHLEDFADEMEKHGMDRDHSERLWADEMENQRDKWGEL